MLDSTEKTTIDTVWADPFQDLTERLRKSLWEKGALKEYRAGARIVGPADPGHRVRYLISGTALVLLHEENGQDISVETVHAGDLIGEISYLMGRASPLNTEVVAREACKVLEIPAPEFDRVLHDNPDAAVSVLRKLSRKVMRLDHSLYTNVRKKRALQELISRQDHVFPDYFLSQTVRRRVGRRLEHMAHVHDPILILGETGVGKDFMAHAIYEMSTHHKGVFLSLDLLRPLPGPEGDPNSTERPASSTDGTDQQMRLFFGSEGIRDGRPFIEMPGYVELTEEGTLLVRGIEQLTTQMQERLLETIRSGYFLRVRGTTRQIADFRLIGTTNLESSEISREQHPLLHWMLANSLEFPPLRKRRKEIPTLVEHYVVQYSREFHKEIRKLPKDTIKTLVTYSWPGNDLELATTLKRAVLLAEGGVLRPQDIYFDLRRIEADGKINLMRVPAVRGALKSPLFPAVFQSAAAPFFFILLVLLFLGPTDPLKNLGGLFSWAVGWPTMIFGAFFWARFWCSLCPMGTLSHLAKRIISLDIPFPSFLKHHSDWIVVASIMFIIWLETATDIRSSPLNTGLLLVTILVLAVAVSVVFERQSWCRYLCPLGGMMGVFAKVSPIELRADRNVCASQCTTNECFVGTAGREGCPFGQMVPSIKSNRFCKICATCVKNCPHGAINLNLRIPGREIWEIRQIVAITAFLVISMFGGLLSELMYKMPIYGTWSQIFPGWPKIVVFTMFFTLVVIAANLLVAAASAVSSANTGETPKENFARYGLALLPLVLTSFMAFHLYYLINVGVYFPIVLWQTFQFEIFHQLVVTVPPAWTLFFQRALIWAGLVGSLVLAYRLGRGGNKVFLKACAQFLPHAVVTLGFALLLQKALYNFFY